MDQENKNTLNKNLFMKLQLLIALGLVSGLEAYAQNVPKTN